MDVHARVGSMYCTPSATLTSKLRKSITLIPFSSPSSLRPSCCRKKGIVEVTIPRGNDGAETLEIGESSHRTGNVWNFNQFVRSYDYILNLDVLKPDDVHSFQKNLEARNLESLDVLEEVLDNARQALIASNESSTFSNKFSIDEFHTERRSDSSNALIREVKTVRSTKRLQRECKRRRASKLDTLYISPLTSAPVKRKEASATDDPLRLFLRDLEKKQLLTYKEECELVGHVQDLLKLEDVNKRLQTQFNRQPTFTEWANAVGLSCHTLSQRLDCGQRSREKLIGSNVRMVAHVAKNYHGCGLSIQDVLQAGTMGLIKSMEKFKLEAGCRFSSYSYWWIRQSIRKAIFHHSRIIRLPDYIYGRLGQVVEAKRTFVEDGNFSPSREEMAARMKISLNKLDRLLFETRAPVSLEQQVWKDQNTTLQEITADNATETPEVIVERQLMRQHVRGLLRNLKAKESLVIRLRYGMEDGTQKTLSEIGSIVGCSKEGVRKLQNRAIEKLKQNLTSHGLHAYKDMLL